MKDIKFWHRVKLPDGTYTPGEVNHGPDGGDWPTTRFGLPADFIGKSVIDIGAWDGFFSFEAERRGARHVIASNPLPPKGPNLEGFYYLQDVLNSNVDQLMLDIEEPNQEFTEYNVVLFYGVLYHLKSPLVAMENVFKLTAPGGMCLLETAMTMDASAQSYTPMLVYAPNTEDDVTNFFYPNEAWINTVSKTVGFTDCIRLYVGDNRMTFKLVK